MAQDTFLKLLRAGAYVPPAEPRAFLATIARRVLIDGSRRLKLEQAYLEALTVCVEQLEHAPSAEQIALALQTLERLTDVLANMKPRVRQAFMLRHLDGLSHSDIAKKLNVSTKSVQTYLIDALLCCDAVNERSL